MRGVRRTNHGRARLARPGGGAQLEPLPGAVTGGQASPDAIMVMPLAEVITAPEPGGLYATVAYRGLTPLFTADGAAVPARAPGRWAQLVQAGRRL